MTTNQILTVSEVALELRCSKAHVYNVIAGKVDGVRALPAISMGRRKLVRRAALEDWMTTNEMRGQSSTLIRRISIHA